MKKIMFNDKFSLTQAVLEGRKTMTRRIVTYPLKFRGVNVAGYFVCKRPSGEVTEICIIELDIFSTKNGIKCVIFCIFTS